MNQTLLDALFSTPAMDAAFSDHSRIQGMLDFEAGLARALHACGLVSASVSKSIITACDADRYNFEELGAATRLAGNPAIPLIAALRAEVARTAPESARWVHHGATSQDTIDTGLVLQLKPALELLDREQHRLLAALATVVRRYRATVMPGRTLLQQAVPVTLGYKAANWLMAVHEARQRLRVTTSHTLVLQFGGAAGTLASLGSAGPAIAQALADELALDLPPLPWHTRRGGIAELGAGVGGLVGALGKLARDVSLLMQSEVAEVFEPLAPGRGGSSAMPQKRNPVGSIVAQAAAARVPALVSILFMALPQEHERGVGGWHAEWETLPGIFRLAAGSLSQVVEVVEGLEVHANRMRQAVDDGLGLLAAEAVAAALAPHLGQDEAHRRVAAASRIAASERRHLRDVLGQETDLQSLSSFDMDALFAPERALGAVDWMIDRALAAAGV